MFTRVHSGNSASPNTAMTQRAARRPSARAAGAVVA